MGALGVHTSVIQFDGLDFDNDHGVTVGVNYRFQRPNDGFWNKALNGFMTVCGTLGRTIRCGKNGLMWWLHSMTDSIGRWGCILGCV